MSAAEVTIRPLRSRPAGDGLGVVAGPVPDLLHPREQEHLVVHRQPEQDAEQDHGLGRLDETQRLEPEQRGQVAVLEDPDQRTEAGDDRERVHDQRLGRQHHRPQEDEQHEVGRHDDEQERSAGSRRGRGRRRRRHRPRRHRRGRSSPAGGASGPVGSRRSATSGLALVAVRAVRRGDRERRQVAPGRRRERGLDVSVARTVRVAVEERVLVERQPRVDIDEAVDARDPWVGGQPARVVVERGEVGRARRRAGRPDGQDDRRELALTELRVSLSKAARDGTVAGRIEASGALNRTCRNGDPRRSSSAEGRDRGPRPGGASPAGRAAPTDRPCPASR